MSRVTVPPEMLPCPCERVGTTGHTLRYVCHSSWSGAPTREKAGAEAAEEAGQTHAFAAWLRVPHRALRRPPLVPGNRTVAGAADAKSSPELLDTLYTMRRRQVWLQQSLVENEVEPLACVASAHLADEPDAVHCEMRREIGLDGGWAVGVRIWQDAGIEGLRRTRGLVGG